MVSGFSKTSEETIIYESNDFFIGMWEQVREDKLSNICINVRNIVDLELKDIGAIRASLISYFPIPNSDMPNEMYEDYKTLIDDQNDKE